MQPPCLPFALQELCELLDIRLVEIRGRWAEGRLQALGFRCGAGLTGQRAWAGSVPGEPARTAGVRAVGTSTRPHCCRSCSLCSVDDVGRLVQALFEDTQLTARASPPLLLPRPVFPSRSVDEVGHLVQALFEDTDLRRDFLRSLEADALL